MKRLLLLLLMGCSPLLRIQDRDILYIKENKERGTREIAYDFNKNGIPELREFYSRYKQNMILRYTYHDLNEDGIPEVITLGRHSRKRGYYFIQ